MKKHRLILGVIIVFAAITWSWNIGYLPLWEDEAHTALLAKSILERGLPTAWDGKHLVSGVQAEDFNEDFIVTWDQPLQFYITALSIKIFGMSNWSARLPFLIAGLFSIFLLYLFVKKLTGNTPLALQSAAVLAISVIFVLHTRQCRYYSLGTMSVLLLYLAYTEIDRRFLAKVLFTISIILLLYSNILMTFTAVLSLFIYHLVFVRSRERLKKMLICAALSIPFTLPWIIYTAPWIKGGPYSGASLAIHCLNIVEMSVKFNRAFFPVIIILISIYLLVKKKIIHNRKYYGLILTTIITPLIIAPLFLLPAIRYIIYLVPFTAFLTALIMTELMKKNKILAAAFAFLIVFTKVFSNLPIAIPQLIATASNIPIAPIKEYVKGRAPIEEKKIDEAFDKVSKRLNKALTLKGLADDFIKMEYLGYLYEITTKYRDPIVGVAEFLKKNAVPGDEVMIMVDAFPLMLYAPEFHYSYIVERPETFSKYALQHSGRKTGGEKVVIYEVIR